MWFKKKEDNNYRTCNECKHLVHKSYIQEVEDGDWLGGDGWFTKYYCPEHKKPYDIIDYKGGYTGLSVYSEDKNLVIKRINSKLWEPTTKHYFKELEVSEDGTPIGYKKIK